MRRGSGCKDPKDLIYSLLGMAPAKLGIEPDYSQLVEYVFADLASHMIGCTGGLDIFSENTVFTIH